MAKTAAVFSYAPRILWDGAWSRAAAATRHAPSTANAGLTPSRHVIAGNEVSSSRILPFGGLLYTARAEKQTRYPAALAAARSSKQLLRQPLRSDKLFQKITKGCVLQWISRNQNIVDCVQTIRPCCAAYPLYLTCEMMPMMRLVQNISVLNGN